MKQEGSARAPFQVREVKVPRYPFITSAVACSGHASGGLLLILGKPGAAFLLITFSLITHILDAYSYSYLSLAGGYRSIPLLVSRRKSVDDGGPVTVIFDASPGPCQKAWTRSWYIASFAGGVVLLLLTTASLMGVEPGSTMSLPGVVLSLSGFFGFPPRGVAAPDEERLRKVRMVSDILLAGEGFTSPLVIVTESPWQGKGFLSRERKNLLPYPLACIRIDDSLPAGSSRIDLSEGMFIPYRVSPAMEKWLSSSLEAADFSVEKKLRGSSAISLSALARGYDAATVSFSARAGAGEVAGGIMAIEKGKM